MNNGIKFIFVFSIGAAVGSLVSWKILKTKFEQIAQEEIESVKKVYSMRQSDDSVLDNTENTTEFDPDPMDDVRIEDYEKILSSYKSIENEQEGGSERVGKKPYVISPDEFGDIDDFDTISLTYYNDKVLTDDMDCIVDNVDEIIGKDSLNHFGEYEDDSVFVRNEILKCDYEILLDSRNYHEFRGKNDA